MRFTTLALKIYLVCFILSLILFLIDRYRSKKLKPLREDKISILIPCYNDGNSLVATVKSVYHAYDPANFQLIVVNDCSTDDSLSKLQKIQSEYGFTLIDNPENIWKALSLNKVSDLAIYDILLVLDADNVLEKRHITSMLARMQKNDRVAAVSCPYVPKNHWFLPAMTNIEYIMLDMVQGSYNLFGAIALRWGCLMVKKSAFIQVWKFSPWMLTEDLDLAFKLNKAGYKVQQSLERIQSLVPTNFKSRCKQKLRRNSGWAHCFIKYPRVWIKNPLHIMLIFSFCLLIFSLATQTAFSFDVIKNMISKPNARDAFWAVFDIKWRVEFFVTKTAYAFLSLPYIFPLITSLKTLWKILWIFPYSLIYIPLYSIMGFISIIHAITHYRKFEKIGKKGWRVR